MLRLLVLMMGALVLLSFGSPAWSHCQIPCGIYGDEMRFQMMEEHLQTIEKSMVQLETQDLAMNQVVRWVANKDLHCQELQDILTSYFLAQRIKPADEGAAHQDYLKSLELVHRMHVRAMKAKQTTDTGHVAVMRELAETFHDHYFKDKEHDHK